MFHIMAYAIVVLKNILYDLKSLFKISVRRRVDERYNKHKIFNLTWRERKKTIVVNKSKIWKIKIWIHDFIRYDATRATTINCKVFKLIAYLKYIEVSCKGKILVWIKNI